MPASSMKWRGDAGVRMTKNEVIVHEYVLKGAAIPYISCMGLTKPDTGHDTLETSIHPVYAEDVVSAQDQNPGARSAGNGRPCRWQISSQ